MSDFTHFVIVALISMIVAAFALKILQNGLQGTPKQFYFNFLGGLISIGVLSIIGSIIYVSSLGDQQALVALCDANPSEATCIDARSKLKIPLFSGMGGMIMFFAVGLTSRINYTKKSNIR